MTTIALVACPLGKLDVGGASSSFSTDGRSRPTTAAAVTNTAACTDTAMPGTTASHHSLVRHHTSAMTSSSAVIAKLITIAVSTSACGSGSAAPRPASTMGGIPTQSRPIAKMNTLTA